MKSTDKIENESNMTLFFFAFVGKSNMTLKTIENAPKLPDDILKMNYN